MPMAVLVYIREPGSISSVPLAIDGDRFVDPATATIERELDTSTWWAIPGLSDCHAHLGMERMGDAGRLTDADMEANAARHAVMQIEGGVLLVLDKGSSSEVTLRVLYAPADRRPELQMAGRIIAGPGGYYPFYALEVDEEGLADAVTEAAATAAGWVKIIGDWPRRGEGPRANYTLAGLRRAVSAAHAAGARVAIHTMAPAVASVAVDAGVDSIEHGTFLTEADLQALAARGGAWVPTVTNTASIVEFLGTDSSGGRLLTEGLANISSLLPVAERLGVTVLAGTDLAVPHGRVAVEAVALRDAGLSTAAALAAVSTSAYAYAGVDRGFRPGAVADVVFVDADPMEELETLLTPRLVIRAGRVVHRS